MSEYYGGDKERTLRTIYFRAAVLESSSRIAEHQGDFSSAVYMLWKSLKLRVEAEFVQCNFIVNSRAEISDLLFSLASLTDCHNIEDLMRGTAKLDGYGRALDLDSEGAFTPAGSEEYENLIEFRRKLDAYRFPVSKITSTTHRAQMYLQGASVDGVPVDQDWLVK